MPELEIKLGRLHAMHLEMHNWVKVDNYIIVREDKNNYFLAKLVDNKWSIQMDAPITKVKIIEEEN